MDSFALREAVEGRGRLCGRESDVVDEDEEGAVANEKKDRMSLPFGFGLLFTFGDGTEAKGFDGAFPGGGALGAFVGELRGRRRMAWPGLVASVGGP